MSKPEPLPRRITWFAPWTWKRRWIAALLILLPVVYLASYPLMYRALVGSDDKPILSKLTPLERAGSRVWRFMERYYFPPAFWIVDNTPAKYPVLWTARVVNAEAQIELQIEVRQLEAKFMHKLRREKNLPPLSSPEN